MAFNFPSSPVLGQEFVSGSSVYVWNGYGWMSKPMPEFVDEVGDTMTGALTIRMSSTLGHLFLDNPVVDEVTSLVLKKNAKYRWSLNATAGPEPGAQVGTNFSIRRYDDAGALLGDTPLNINRATGRAQVGQQPVDPNDIATKAYVDTTFGGGGPGYLPLTGGTLSGGLTAPTITLNGPTGGQVDLWGQLNATPRWLIRMTDGFELHRYDNAGGYIGMPFNINRLTGNGAFSHDLGVTGQMSANVVAAPTGFLTNFTSTTATITNCSSSGTFSLTALSCNTLVANAITDNGTLTVSGISNLNGNATAPVFTASTEFQSSRGDGLLVLRVAGGGGVVRIDTNGNITHDYGVACKPGILALARSNSYNIDFNGGAAGMWIDATHQGNFAYSSDYRIKKAIAPLPDMWDTVKQLKPIKYTQAEFDPPSAVKAPEGEDPRPPMFPADEIERWGFVAHELQELLVPSAATGEKDSPNIIQSPNPWTIIAALTKSLQEAMVRIELLESKVR